jgi:hypothetical protein
MTRDRLFGSDAPFMSWCRSCKLLPSWSADCGWVQTDVDSFIHRYLTCVDRQGTREVQPMMEIEVKTRSGNLTASQIDTYRKKHATTIPHLKWNGQWLVNYGVSFVRMDGTSPVDSQSMMWGRFKRSSLTEIAWHEIVLEQLIDLLRFELNPDTLAKNSFRRHHKTRKVLVCEETPLGFIADRELTARS